MRFITFGEVMLRLTPEVSGVKISSAKSFDVGFAGAEANVASSLATLGNQVDFVTKFPENQLGDAAISSLRSLGINTSSILRGGDRMGTYFIEMGTSIRPSSVIYDRQGSSISKIGPDEFDWGQLLQGKQWIFLTGITPVLSKQCADETVRAARTAREMGVKVGFDMNFRRSLWSCADEARMIFNEILQCTDLLFGNTGALKDVYGFRSLSNNAAEETMEAAEYALDKFGINGVAFTIREHQSASKNVLSALYLSGTNHCLSRSYEVDIVDRFGAGDAFAAGILHGIGRGWDTSKTVEFAAAAFALKHTLKGDLHLSGEKEIQFAAEGQVSGHVLR